MAPKVDKGTILILDVGRNTSSEKGKSFYEETRECAARLIEQKILSQGKYLVGILLLGSKKTKNNMAEQAQGSFRHIELLSELQTPTWQMIRDLPEKASNSRGDWLEALIVAADHFKSGAPGFKIMQHNIILMTNFQSPTNFEVDEVEQILEGLKEENFEVDVLGPDIFDESQSSPDIDLAKRFVESTNGQTAPFDYTMNYLQFHRKKVTNPMPWNIDLSIGPNVKIPVSTYIRLKDEPIVKNWQKAIKDPITLKSSASEGIMKIKEHFSTENQTVVEPENIIKGYHYGQQIIPFSECDKSMLYDSGDKCLSVYGFTNASNVTWQNLNGDGLHYILGRKGDKKAQHAVQCLVECLHELKLVGLVRRVYNKGNAPKMFALMPVIDTNNFVCLSMAGVCFKEEIKNMAFPPTSLNKYACTKEQVNAFKDLIKAMDLTDAYDDTCDDKEAFPIAESVSPTAQYILDCIAYRALNPGKPLPPPRDEIMSLFKQPPLIEKRSREPVKKLKDLFTLVKVEPKSRKKNVDLQIDDTIMKPADNGEPSTSDTDTKYQAIHDIPKIQLPPVKKDEINRIGSVDPINDFKTLIGKGKTLSDLSSEMTKVIENLICYNLDGKYVKAFDTMKFFRTECVRHEPSQYNDWLKQFRVALASQRKDNILSMIKEKEVGFISKQENDKSTFDTHDSQDESQVYENDTVPNSAEITISTEVNDIFDEV